MSDSTNHVLAWMPGQWQWPGHLVVALPDLGTGVAGIARSVGKSLTEFKKGITNAKESSDDLVE